MAEARRTLDKPKVVEPVPLKVERVLKQTNTPAGNRLSANNKKLSESILDLIWTLVDNGVVSVDDAAPVIEVLADIIDCRETK